MLKTRTHFEQVPVALVEKLLKPAAENALIMPKKAKGKISGIVAAQQLRVVGAKS